MNGIFVGSSYVFDASFSYCDIQSCDTVVWWVTTKVPEKNTDFSTVKKEAVSSFETSST